MPRSSYSWQNLGVKFCCCKQFSEYVSLSSLLVSLFVLLVPADCKHQEEGQIPAITFAMSGPSAQNTIYKYIDYLELVMLGLYRHYCLFLKFLRQHSLLKSRHVWMAGNHYVFLILSFIACDGVLMMIELLIWDICLRFWHVPASKARDETDQIFECFEKESVDMIRAFYRNASWTPRGWGVPCMS